MAKKHVKRHMQEIGKINAQLPEVVNQYLKKEISRRDFLAHSTALGLSASIAYGIAGTDVAKASGHTVKKGGKLRMGMSVPEVKDPQNFQWIEMSNMTRGTTEYLTHYGSDAAVKPYLAKSWKISDGGKSFDINLREGIKWTNGDEFNADDVVFNFNRWRKDGNESINRSEWGPDTMGDPEKTGEHSVRLHLTSPDVTVAHRLFAYPATIVNRKFDDEGSDLPKNPVGTGPLLLKEYSVGQRALMVRNDNYWGGPDGKGNSYLDAVEYVDLGNDDQASLNALASGQVDWLYKLSPRQKLQMKNIPGMQIEEITTAQTPCIRFNIEAAPFDNIKLREAIVLAISNADVLQKAYNNNGSPAENHHTAPIQPDYFKLDFNSGEQNIERAKQLVKEHGFDQQAYEVTLGNTQGPFESDACQVISQHCAKVGINLKLNLLPTAQYWEVWDKSPFGLTFWTHRPLAVMLHKLAYVSTAVWNESHFKSKVYDDALKQAQAQPTPKDSQKYLKIMESQLSKNFVMVQPFWINLLTGGKKNVQDFPVHQQEYYPMHRVWLS